MVKGGLAAGEAVPTGKGTGNEGGKEERQFPAVGVMLRIRGWRWQGEVSAEGFGGENTFCQGNSEGEGRIRLVVLDLQGGIPYGAKNGAARIQHGKRK